MDSIAQIKAIYSSLIEGIIPKAEEILEKIGMFLISSMYVELHFLVICYLCMCLFGCIDDVCIE